MPRGGAVTLSDVREPALVIVCEPCERRGRYRVERLMAEHGDAMLTDLLTILADCPKARSMSVHDRQALAVRRLHREGGCGVPLWAIAATHRSWQVQAPVEPQERQED